MAHGIPLSELRVRVLDGESFPPKERRGYVTRDVAGRLLAVLYRDTEIGDTVYSQLVNKPPAKKKNGEPTEDQLFQAALRNVADTLPASVEVMRVSEDCQIFFFHDPEVPNVSGRILDLDTLIAAARDGLPAEARALTESENGAIVGVPNAFTLVVYFPGTGDLIEGAVNVAANTLANYDEEDEGAVSPWVYWVKGEHVEEMRYETDEDGEVTSISLPDALLVLLATE